MGLIRKSMSISTLGLVSYRNKSDQALRAQKQTAKYTKQARNAGRVGAISSIYGNLQNSRAQKYQEAVDWQAWQAEQARLAWEAQQAHAALPKASAAGPGWYPDPYDPRCMTWWDGQQWHPASKHLP